LNLPDSDQLYVTDGGEGAIKVLRGSDYTVVDTRTMSAA
jgi:hypothetical protein